MDFLSELNEAQRGAVTAYQGPVMIIAGAGSGKTRVLTYRLAFIIDQGFGDPFECLALTFTNKAAKEMKERIEKLIGPEGKNIWMGTFHSIFARILRMEAEKLQYTSNFTIYDQDDSLSLIKKIIKELNLDDKKFKPKLLSNHISGAKNAVVDPVEYATNYISDSVTSVVAKVYEIYNKRLFNANAMDFDDLLVKPIELFNAFPDVLYKWQRKFKYIMVDEFQDTNHAQYVITRMLGAQHENICVVGDDAQSIYSFRGATIQNILNFKKDYPDTRIFKLEQNYRSTKVIVGAANQIIARNKNQIKKTVFTENDDGDHIKVFETVTDNEEAKVVCDQIREMQMRFNYRSQDFAILYRTNAQSRSIETELRRQGIHYKIFGGLSFYRRKEIKDVVAYFKLAINPRDEASLTRVINYPTRGIGQTTLDQITVIANERGLSLWEVVSRIHEFGFNGRVVNSVSSFALIIKSYIALAQSQNAFEVAKHIAQHTGILKELHTENSIESLSRWENVQELLNAAREFSEDTDYDAHTLDAFLAEISLFSDQDQEDENSDYVTLMTIHSAKGLEFPAVFLVGMEEELFPSFMAMQSRADLEEERRLFYVAVTRAKERLILTHAKSRFKYGNLTYCQPSRFLEEIGEEYLHQPQNKPSSSPQGSPQVTKSRLTPMMYATRQVNSGSQTFEGDDLSKLNLGDEVIHQKFGQGKVKSLEGDGNQRKANVVFQDKGEKVLLLKYAKLKIIS